MNNVFENDEEKSKKKFLLAEIEKLQGLYGFYQFLNDYFTNWELTGCNGKQEYDDGECISINNLETNEIINSICGCKSGFKQCVLVHWIKDFKEEIVNHLERDDKELMKRYWLHCGEKCSKKGLKFDYDRNLLQNDLRQFIQSPQLIQFFSIDQKSFLPEKLFKKLKLKVSIESC